MKRLGFFRLLSAYVVVGASSYEAFGDGACCLMNGNCTVTCEATRVDTLAEPSRESRRNVPMLMPMVLPKIAHRVRWRSRTRKWIGPRRAGQHLLREVYTEIRKDDSAESAA